MPESKLNKLADERTGLRSQEASSTVSIWELPNEVLSHIIVMGLSTEGVEVGSLRQKDEKEKDIPEKPDFAILVSHVSHHFREVAIKTPTLWSRIHVHDLEEQRLHYIETCLQRSGSLPYSLCLDCEYHYQIDPPLITLAVEPVMLLVKANIYRLERFMAKFRFFTTLHGIMTRLNEPAPQLTTLELYHIDYEQFFEENTLFFPRNLRDPLVLFDGQAPKLSKLILDSVHVAWSRCHFKNLTTLELGYHALDVRPTYQEFQAIMKDSPMLRQLSLRSSAPLLSDDSITTISRHYMPFVLDSLERLRISDISPTYASTLISLFRAFNLKTLVLSGLHTSTNDFSPMFDRIAGPPSFFPNLTALKLIFTKASDASVTGLLRACPNLEWLGLYAFSTCLQWVSKNQSMGPTEHLCPNLKTLRWFGNRFIDIQTMMMNRMNANLPLPKLELHGDELQKGIYYSYSNASSLIWLTEHVDVKFIGLALSRDSSDWVSEESGPYFDASAIMRSIYGLNRRLAQYEGVDEYEYGDDSDGHSEALD